MDDRARETDQERPADSGGGGPLAQGLDVIRRVLKTLPHSPGVYRMLNQAGDALYVGKARNLRNRVANYTHPATLPIRLQRMVAETRSMEIVTTHTEVEALLLEVNLIKRLMPRDNVLLRDDKSFPYIHLRTDHPVAQLTKHRGAPKGGGEYFGPFASAGAVNRTITALHRAFLLRSCSDSIFATRTRPCLQYQIKRCSAPCVDRIAPDAYRALVGETREFLTGRSTGINRKLAAEMTEASDRLDYERAAEIRNRIRALAQIQAGQNINVSGVADADIVAAYQEGGHTCVQVFFFRGGQNWGNRAYFPSHDRQIGLAEVLAAFLGQFYDGKPPPPLVLISDAPSEQALLQQALSEQAGRKVQLHVPLRGDKRKPVEHALANAREALGRRLAESSSQRRLLRGVQEAFGLDAAPERIEVYDNSHIQGANAIGAMIVAGPDGFDKHAYRKFTMKGARYGDSLLNSSSAPCADDELSKLSPYLAEAAAGYAPGDDYAMMREMLQRRFRRALDEDPDRARGQWPDLVLIDGGAGQLAVAQDVFAEMQIDDVALVAIAKGPDRDAGRERFFLPGREPVSFEPRDPVLYFLQRLRDEAHRFAIGAHRARRQKALGVSPLDEVAGIGPRRKRALLHHFGSAREVARAGLADLEQVEGISATVARKIYDHFQAR